MTLNAPYGPAGIYGGREEKVEKKMDIDALFVMNQWKQEGQFDAPSPQPPADAPSPRPIVAYHAFVGGNVDSRCMICAQPQSDIKHRGPYADRAPSPGAQDTLPLSDAEITVAMNDWTPDSFLYELGETALAAHRLQAALEAEQDACVNIHSDLVTAKQIIAGKEAALEATERKLREAEAQAIIAKEQVKHVQRERDETLAANATLQREKEEARAEIVRLNMEEAAGRVPTWSYKAAVKELSEANARAERHYQTIDALTADNARLTAALAGAREVADDLRVPPWIRERLSRALPSPTSEKAEGGARP